MDGAEGDAVWPGGGGCKGALKSRGCAARRHLPAPSAPRWAHAASSPPRGKGTVWGCLRRTVFFRTVFSWEKRCLLHPQDDMRRTARLMDGHRLAQQETGVFGQWCGIVME
ncbi:cortexin-1 isoform X1 [Podarcis raffonei]|uniref:cortexin-1 isoform X1 n=1 Tax=Podarcis raffonei TaxID=65483 RepID=UPI0023297242|nr:cortexin-1 isoform X1 [Podarcis raffonei]